MDRSKSHLPCGLDIQPADADRSAVALHCFTRRDGVHFCPTDIITYGMWGELHIALTFELGRKGLIVAFTPQGAREAAAQLLELAARAEANLAETTAAQLDGIGKRGTS